MEFLVPFIFALLAFFGLVAAVIPGIPAIFYMFLVSLVFALIDGFVHLSQFELLILLGIYLVSFCVDAFSGVIGAKYGGASFRSFFLGILGAIIGMLALPPLGGLLGLFAGIFFSEIARHRSGKDAARAASFGVLGMVAGLVVNVVLAIVFFSSFITLAFFL
jgi:uncharacterized protein YqgC (DUF456 family)